MSESQTAQLSAQGTAGDPGIATRCQLLRMALAEHGPLTLMELREELDRRLASLVPGWERTTPLADDLTTLLVGGWVEPSRADPDRLRLIEDAPGDLPELNPESPPRS